MAAVSRMSNPERVVITAVLAGVLRIDDQGRVWRIQDAKETKG